MARFFGELGLDLAPGVAHVLPQDVQWDLALLLFVLVVHVQTKNMRGDCLVDSFLSNVANNENVVETGQY